MRGIGLAGVTAAMVSGGAAWAEVPRVTTDILPVQGLVARVMAGLGVPDVVIGPGADPHSHQMRPSEAASLANADLVVWIGPDLSPAFTRARDGLAAGTAVLTLADLPDAVRLPFRDDHGGDDDEEHSEHDEHGHGEHADDSHSEDKTHNDEGHDDKGHDDHAKDDAAHAEHGDDHQDDDHGEDHGDNHAGGLDPHLWLDPQNAAVFLGAIADALSQADPANADAYRANAAEGLAEISAVTETMTEAAAAVQAVRLLAYHDAYQYLEARFGLEIDSSLIDAAGNAPGARHLAEVQESLAGAERVCVLADPGYRAERIETVLAGIPHSVMELDPLGATIPPGPGFYPALIASAAAALETCAG